VFKSSKILKAIIKIFDPNRIGYFNLSLMIKLKLMCDIFYNLLKQLNDCLRIKSISRHIEKTYILIH